MAKMIPEVFDQDTLSSAEHTFYYTLQDGLDKHYTVIHSLPWLDGQPSYFKQGECDFLVVHPERGMLVIEVKSGTPRYDNQRGVWEYAGSHQIKNPFEQAKGASHYLNNLLGRQLEDWCDARPAFGYAVAFPDARNVLGNLLPEMSEEILILEPDLPRIQKVIDSALEKFGTSNRIMDPALMKSALDVLVPKFELVPSMHARIKKQKHELLRLTEEQSRVLRGAQRNRRLFACGGAGTGKTLLVQELAIRRAGAGEKVLVLCYNRPLHKHLAEVLGAQAHIDVHTFHNICEKIVTEASGPIDHSSIKNLSEYYDEKLPESALDLLDAYSDRYDAILVDEAQDFLDLWWLPVEGLLKDAALSRFYIFADEQQNVYKRDRKLPFTEPGVELMLNCRNTRPITRWIYQAAGLPEPEDIDCLPDGDEPQILEVSGPEEEVKEVRGILHMLINDKGLKPEQIVILGRHVIGKSAFADTRKLGNVEIYCDHEKRPALGVQYSTIHKFKGLEADCVILTGVGEPSSHYTEDDEKIFQYVGGSRARVLLFVLHR